MLTLTQTCVILNFTCERGFFVARFSLFKPRRAGPGREAVGFPQRKVNIRRCRNNASQSDPEMQRVQAEKLQYHEEQEKHTGQAGAEQVLPFLPEAHAPQRDQIIEERAYLKNGRSEEKGSRPLVPRNEKRTEKGRLAQQADGGEEHGHGAAVLRHHRRVYLGVRLCVRLPGPDDPERLRRLRNGRWQTARNGMSCIPTPAMKTP